MTRETRVGLLLGLAIIIAIGMILSEVTQPEVQDARAQQLAIDSGYYRQKDVPLEDVTFRPADSQREYAEIATDGDNDELPQAVPARVELGVVVPAENRSCGRLAKANILRQAEARFVRPPATRAEQARSRQHPILFEKVENSANDGLEDRQRQYVRQSDPNLARRRPQASTYTVEPNDSLYKIAAKVYGSGKGQLYKKIYEANRNTMSDPSTVIVGQKLVIPPLEARLASAGDVGIALRDQRALDELQQELRRRSSGSASRKTRAVNGKRSFYVVRRGDNLTRIAGKTLNDTSEAAIRKIYEANRDRLEDRDSIFEGMKLRIPS